MQRNLQTNFKL